MVILTNPGSNLSPAVVARYGIELTPQKIVVDGVEHDTRGEIDPSQIDTWVRTAREHPYVLGTSAAEFAATFAALTKRDRHVLAVMTSRNLIGSHDSAVAAKGALEKQPGRQHVDIRVVDSGFTDIGAGLACILAAEGAAAGHSMNEVVALLDAYRTQSCFALVPDTLEYLVKGGRATALRAFLANVFGVRPLIGMVDGGLTVHAKISTANDRGEAIAAYAERQLGGGRPVWVGIFHGNAPARASSLAESLRRRFVVQYECVRPLAASIYLHGGPGVVGAVVTPVDRLPSRVETPQVV